MRFIFEFRTPQEGLESQYATNACLQLREKLIVQEKNQKNFFK